MSSYVAGLLGAQGTSVGGVLTRKRPGRVGVELRGRDDRVPVDDPFRKSLRMQEDSICKQYGTYRDTSL